jgi:hypothetical protein
MRQENWKNEGKANALLEKGKRKLNENAARKIE